MKLRLVILSDTYNRKPWFKIPDGDILVHCGDMTMHGGLDEVSRFNDFLGGLPHPHKVVIAGNHDTCFESQPEASRPLLTNATYLQDEAATVGGIRFYGSPWQPLFRDMAFNLPDSQSLRAKWALIPPGIDVLVTHTPPYGQRDRIFFGQNVGDQELLKTVEQLKVRLHLFGHIHESYGRSANRHTIFINASTCNLLYLAWHRPVVFDFPLN